MRATINFDQYIHGKREFWRLLRELSQSTGGNICLVGTSGISVSHLSWNDAFTFGARVVELARDDGLTFLKSMRMYIQDDVEESPMPLTREDFP